MIRFFREDEEKCCQWKYVVKSFTLSWSKCFRCVFVSVQISYLCVLRAVGRSAGTLPDQKMRIKQLVSSTILIFLVCFSPYHVFLLVRTVLERDCNFITGTQCSRWLKGLRTSGVFFISEINWSIEIYVEILLYPKGWFFLSFSSTNKGNNQSCFAMYNLCYTNTDISIVCTKKANFSTPFIDR